MTNSLKSHASRLPSPTASRTLTSQHTRPSASASMRLLTMRQSGGRQIVLATGRFHRRATRSKNVSMQSRRSRSLGHRQSESWYGMLHTCAPRWIGRSRCRTSVRIGHLRERAPSSAESLRRVVEHSREKHTTVCCSDTRWLTPRSIKYVSQVRALAKIQNIYRWQVYQKKPLGQQPFIWKERWCHQSSNCVVTKGSSESPKV